MTDLNKVYKDITIQKLIDNINNDFRNLFSSYIITYKTKIHQCQLLCYKDSIDLSKSELCAQECYKPLLMVKKSVTDLMIGKIDEFEECKLHSNSNKRNSEMINCYLRNCIEKYKEGLFKNKDEVEYLYKGYLKNLV